MLVLLTATQLMLRFTQPPLPLLNPQLSPGCASWHVWPMLTVRRGVEILVAGVDGECLHVWA
jgi:hypothetical protein